MEIPNRLLIGGPSTINGICADALPSKPNRISATSVAARTGAAICTPNQNTAPAVVMIESVNRPLSLVVPGGR